MAEQQADTAARCEGAAGDGLTHAEVAERVARGQANAVKEPSSRTYWHIIRANVFTRFNAILGVLFVLILIFGQLRDGLFGLVLLANTFIGIVQEVRAKRTLDRLSLLSAPRARVVREGKEEEIALGDVVLDDVIVLRTGDQIVADGEVLNCEGLEVDESLLTGESAPVHKQPGEQVYSGSFVVAGAGRVRATKVGADAYARKLASEAKKFQRVSSDLRDGINKLLRYITWVMVPAAVLLIISQLRVNNGVFAKSVTGMVAGLVGMVPEGLVLLTSVAFAVSVIALARRKVLVQELPAVEGLARVDTVCLDKTGTLTEGSLVFEREEALHGGKEADVETALAAFGADRSSHSSTQDAIAAAFPAKEGVILHGSVPFSSERKWSAVSLEGDGEWVLGAPEVLLDKADADPALRDRVNELAASGARVLMLAKADNAPEHETLPAGLRPAALLLFEEKVRGDAPETLQYFTDQGVAIKVISGDNPVTVGAVALRAGVPDPGEPRDARGLPEDPEQLAEAMDSTTVFGRVRPDQKQAMVGALQDKGHVVAMTGDGVNDVLALKKADIGIAMGSGSPAAKSVAELVLLDGRFATLPGVVAEGRRVIANIERVANLFLTKTVYATILSLAIALAGWKFVFRPIHMSVISALTIGAPALVLSFTPNKQRYRPGFLKRVLRFAVPAGVVMAAAAFAAAALSHIYPWVSPLESTTAAMIVLGILGLFVLAVLARPYTWWKLLLVVAMALGFVLVIGVPPLRSYFDLDLPQWSVLLQTAAIAGVGLVLLEVVWRLSGWQQWGRDPNEDE